MVSPKRVYFGLRRPTIPAMQGPECSPTRICTGLESVSPMLTVMVEAAAMAAMAKRAMRAAWSS